VNLLKASKVGLSNSGSGEATCWNHDAIHDQVAVVGSTDLGQIAVVYSAAVSPSRDFPLRKRTEPLCVTCLRQLARNPSLLEGSR